MALASNNKPHLHLINIFVTVALLLVTSTCKYILIIYFEETECIHEQHDHFNLLCIIDRSACNVTFR
jgi:hypothetical protein